MGSDVRSEQRRLLLIGIDGFSPPWLSRFMAEGALPGFAGMARDGSQVPLVSTLPATTPVAWATIASGAPPSRTGIEGFLIHRPGDPLDQRVSGCYAHRCRTEPIWETASMCGRRSVVLKFPLSYPSTTASLRVDGAAGWGGLRCLHELASPALTVAGEAGSQDGPRLHLDPARSEDRSEDGSGGRVRGRWCIPTLWGGPDIILWCSMARSTAGEPLLALSWAPEAAPIATLRAGEWSQPLRGRGTGRQGEVDFAFRVKALALSVDPPVLRLFHTALHELQGYASPAATWERYLADIGPIEEQTDPSLMLSGGIDMDTQLELFRLNADWLQRAATTLMHGERWHLFMLQVHFVDWAHHMLHGAIDPRHPDYDPAKAPHYIDILRQSYRLADTLIVRLREAVVGEADVVVVGDHGQDLHHTTLHTNEWLAAQGLLRWAGAGNEIDWRNTRAYAAGNYIYLNLGGREPEGIVAPAEAPALRARIIDGLLGLSDAADGARPVLIAGPKEEFERLGADGVGVGDIVFCLRSGYQARNSRGALFTPTRALREFTSGHDHFWPYDPRLHTRMFAAGPSFRRGHVHPRLESLIDVAPTLSAALGMAAPAHSEGRVIESVLVRPGAYQERIP